MSKRKQRPLFDNLISPQMRLEFPSKILSFGEFENLRLTVEDFRYITQEPIDDLPILQAEIRSRSTILRRLLVAGDLFNAGRHFRPVEEFRVTARMLDFDPPHPSIIISCGNYPWKGDLLPGMSATLSVRGVEPLLEPTWKYRDEADVSLKEYLNGLAIAVLGTPIRRRELVKYIADKKAAHVSDKRNYDCERAMDSAWSSLAITLVSTENVSVSLNMGYLEILAIIEALAQSQSINRYISELESWLQTGTPTLREGERALGAEIPKIPIRPING